MLELGFAAFFLNRTNRSGILNGGIIGGRDQSGPWKIDARFNAKELAHRVESIAKLRSRVKLSREDAKNFLLKRLNSFPQNTLIYLDPPYYIKGKELYHHYYDHQDHEAVAKIVTSKIKRQKWIVSYDNVVAIKDMYAPSRSIVYGIGYSAREARDGSEVMFFCDGMEIPSLTGAMKTLRNWAA
jgi:DNA adenine methylase